MLFNVNLQTSSIFVMAIVTVSNLFLMVTCVHIMNSLDVYDYLKYILR